MTQGTQRHRVIQRVKVTHMVSVRAIVSLSRQGFFTSTGKGRVTRIRQEKWVGKSVNW